MLVKINFFLSSIQILKFFFFEFFYVKSLKDGTSITITASCSEFNEPNVIGYLEDNSKTLLLPTKHVPIFKKEIQKLSKLVKTKGYNIESITNHSQFLYDYTQQTIHYVLVLNFLILLEKHYIFLNQ